MSNRFVTADTHFAHANIIKYCHRPFRDADDMGEQMETLWNETVKPDDEVYHLGDFYWIRGDNWFSAEMQLKSLHGKIHLIKGDHDPGLPQFKKARFDEIFASMDYFKLVDRVLLIHDYEQRWKFFRELDGKPGKRYTEDGYKDLFDIAFCGHVHRHWLHSNVNRQGDKRPSVALNIGVDMWNYRPVPWEVAVETQGEWLEYCQSNEIGKHGGWTQTAEEARGNG